MEPKKATIKDVAERANVSKSTVSYVLNNVDKVSVTTKQRVLKAMEELDYVPNTTARQLAKSDYRGAGFKETVLNDNFFYQEFMQSFVSTKTGRNTVEKKTKLVKAIEEMGYVPSMLFRQFMNQSKTTIGIIMSFEKDFKHTILEYNPFYQEFISGAEYAARANELTLDVININDMEANEVVIDEKKYMGIIVLGQFNRSVGKKLSKISIPVVLVDYYSSISKYILLSSNDRQGAFNSVEYLIQKGHKRIAFVGGDLSLTSVYEERYKGYEEALVANGMKVNGEDVYFVDLTYEDGTILAEKIVKEGPLFDAIFCVADITAIGLLKGFTKAGISVPEDISIIGFDNISFSRYCHPELTTVDQNIFLKAETAIELLIRHQAGEMLEKEYILPVSLVERESVRDR